MTTYLLARVAVFSSKFQTFDALRHRNFRLYWFANIGQSAALGMQFLIIGWLVLELTNSASQLGFVIFLYGIPNLVMLTFGGVIADRIDRRKMLLTSQSLVGTLVLLLAVLTLSQLVSIWHLYAAAFIIGVIQGLNMPARMAIVPDLVGRDDILNATALNSAVMNSGRIIGPSLAGFIIEYVGMGHALLFNTICYATSLLFLLMISGVFSRGEAKGTNVFRDVFEGWRFFATTPVVFTIIGIGFSFGLFGAAIMQVLPAFGKEVLKANAGTAGMLLSSVGIGSLVGNLVLASLGDIRYKNLLLLGTITFFGITLFLFAWSPWYIVSIAILFFVGMGFTGYISVGTTVLQLTTPTELRGRIMSMWLMGAALHYVGALPMGLVADYYGWPIAVAGGALAMLTVVMWLGVSRPTLRRLRI